MSDKKQTKIQFANGVTVPVKLIDMGDYAPEFTAPPLDLGSITIKCEPVPLSTFIQIATMLTNGQENN